MRSLKPRGGFRRLTPGLHEVIDAFAEGGIGCHAPEPVPGDRLQDGPGVIRELPQRGIKLSPYLVGSVIPRPAHIQSELDQRIESLDVRR